MRRIWTRLSVGALMLLALPINNATAAQATNQIDWLNEPPLKRASKTDPKPHRPQPIYLTPKVAEILRLNKASISDDVIVAYIEKSPTEYAVTSPQLISLRNAGMSERVLKTLAEHRSATPEELSSVGGPPLFSPNGVPQASDPTGRWVYIPGYGWYWQSAAPFSQPYGSDTYGLPPLYASVSDGGTVVIDDGHHHHHPHVEHHNSQNSSHPFPPVGGQLPSGNLPPYGVAGQPLAPNNGAYPFLPVGGTPANGSLPPYGVAGQPIVPNSGAYPYLPVGGHPASGNLPPYGIAPSFAGCPINHFTPIPYLPAAPMLPSPPTLYNPATYPYPNSPPTGFYPLSPPTGFSTAAMRGGGSVPAGGFHGGFHGGGGGGGHVGGGGHR